MSCASQRKLIEERGNQVKQLEARRRRRCAALPPPLSRTGEVGTRGSGREGDARWGGGHVARSTDCCGCNLPGLFGPRGLAFGRTVPARVSTPALCVQTELLLMQENAQMSSDLKPTMNDGDDVHAPTNVGPPPPPPFHTHTHRHPSPMPKAQQAHPPLPRRLAVGRTGSRYILHGGTLPAIAVPSLHTRATVTSFVPIVPQTTLS